MEYLKFPGQSVEKIWGKDGGVLALFCPTPPTLYPLSLFGYLEVDETWFLYVGWDYHENTFQARNSKILRKDSKRKLIIMLIFIK